MSVWKDLNIEDAGAQEIANFLMTHKGIQGLNFRQGREVMLAKLRETGYSGDTIKVAVEDEGAKGLKVGKESFPNAQKVRIRIHNSSGPGGTEPVWAAVNGRGMWIPRNKDVEIPAPYVEVLQHAEERIFDTDENNQIIGYHDQPLYPFTTLFAPSPSAVQQ